MELHSTGSRLKKELSKKQISVLFQRAKNHQPVFTEFDTPISILDALSNGSNNGHVVKEGLTRALIEEQQSRPHPLWSGLLVTSYMPMLVRLRTRLRRITLPPEDLDQLVVYSFLEVVQEFPLSRWQTYTCVRLSHQTRRRVFREIKRETRHRCLFDQRSPDELSQQELEERYLWGDRRRQGRESDDTEQLLINA